MIFVASNERNLLDIRAKICYNIVRAVWKQDTGGDAPADKKDKLWEIMKPYSI